MGFRQIATENTLNTKESPESSGDFILLYAIVGKVMDQFKIKSCLRFDPVKSIPDLTVHTDADAVDNGQFFQRLSLFLPLYRDFPIWQDKKQG